MSALKSPGDKYKNLLTDIKIKIRSSHVKAAYAVNSTLIQLYWNIGELIAKNQSIFQGRNNYIDQLARDIQNEFPTIKGFSKRNLFVIRSFYLFYSPVSVQQVVALKSIGVENIQQAINKVPWGHHVQILTKVKDTEQAIFYLGQTIENNWS